MDHVFVYDNAMTHQKCEDRALSACSMPKGTSGSVKGKENSNFLCEVTKHDHNGNPVHNPETGQVEKEKFLMTGAKFADGTPQSLYFPFDHPRFPGKFKGMSVILEEQGLGHLANLRFECPGFKCQDVTADCCCCRVLYNQPDLALVKSVLEHTCEELGVSVLFLPKFHCELNPIEMCWGYAKHLYRLKLESSHEDVLKLNTLESIDAIPLDTMV